LVYAGWQTSGSSITHNDSEDDETPILESCEDLKGEECSSTEYCSGKEVDSTDGLCCLGDCKKESDGGNDKPVPEPKSKSIFSYWYVWVLFVLIILTVLAIVFKDKLRVYFFRVKSNLGKGDGPSPVMRPGPGFPPRPAPPRKMTYSKGYPPRKPVRRTVRPETEKEFEDVLKKLKDIGQ
jgi:hypothetical protein